MLQFHPANDILLSSALSYFDKTAQIFSSLIACIFFMRICFLIIKISPLMSFADLYQDIILYFATILIFPKLIDLLLTLITGLAEKLSVHQYSPDKPYFQKVIENLFFDYPAFIVFSKVGHIFITYIASSIYTLFLTLLIASAPIFIFLSVLLNLGSTLKNYFTLFISLSLWPVLWNLIGGIAQNLITHFSNAPVSSFCFYFVLLIIQLLTPIFTYTLIKNLSLDVGATKIMSFGGKVCP